MGILSIVHVDQRPGVSAEAFIGDTVPLLDVSFRLKLAPVGEYPEVFQIGSQTNPLSLISLTSGGADVSDDQRVAKACQR